MVTEKMLDLAFAYKKARLWRRVYDSELFAVRLPDGETGYCCVMGMMGEHNALMLYIGDQGFECYRRIARASENPFPELGIPDWFLTQDGIECAFERKDDVQSDELDVVRDYARLRGMILRGVNAWPVFTRYLPGHQPWRIETREDEARICEALDAAAALSGMLRTRTKAQLGITDWDGSSTDLPLLVRDRESGLFRLERVPVPGPLPEVYPTPAPLESKTVAKLRKLEKRHILECEMIRLPVSAGDENGGVPWFPTLLLCVESSDGSVLMIPPAEHFEEKPDLLLNNFVDTLLKNDFCPRALRVRNNATRALLEEFCMRTGALITVDEYLPELDEAKEAFLEHFQENSEEDESPDEEVVEEMFQALMSMPDRELKLMPEILVNQLLDMASMGLMPPELEKRLRRLFHR